MWIRKCHQCLRQHSREQKMGENLTLNKQMHYKFYRTSNCYTCFTLCILESYKNLYWTFSPNTYWHHLWSFQIPESISRLIAVNLVRVLHIVTRVRCSQWRHISGGSEPFYFIARVWESKITVERACGPTVKKCNNIIESVGLWCVNSPGIGRCKCCDSSSNDLSLSFTS